MDTLVNPLQNRRLPNPGKMVMLHVWDFFMVGFMQDH